MPVALLTAAAVTLLAPVRVVDWIAVPVILCTVFFLYLAGMLLRPMDRRAWRRWRMNPRRDRKAAFSLRR
jgi:hypothetical protein